MSPNKRFNTDAMLRLDHACPGCGVRFVPWRLWRITRWTCISCPSCGIQLGRVLDRRFALLLLGGAVLVPLGVTFLIATTPWPVWVLCLLALVLIFYLLDVLAVQLVVAGKPKGRAQRAGHLLRTLR